jgi:hypothetical protein
MNFYIKQNSILPNIKMKLYMDGRLDYKKFHNLLENATATFSMKNIENGVFKIINKESQIVEVLNGDNPEFYIQYNWNINDTLESGLFEGQFRIDFLDECSYIIVPIREKLYINILSSFTKAEIEENNNLIDSDSCLIYCQEYQFTGGTVSGTTEFLSDVNICEGDLYVHNILGCSPITINNNLEVDEDLFTISGETRFLNTLTGTTAYFDNIFSGNTDLNDIINQNNLIEFNRQTDSYNLILSDLGKMVEINSLGDEIILIPNNDTTPFPIGSQILISQYGDGQVIINGGVGVDLRISNNENKTRTKYSIATLIKVGLNEWYVSGDLTS